MYTHNAQNTHTHTLHTAWTGQFCEEDVDGCSIVSCFEGVQCFDVQAPGTGAMCGPCPTGYSGDGVKCSGKRHILSIQFSWSQWSDLWHTYRKNQVVAPLLQSSTAVFMCWQHCGQLVSTLQQPGYKTVVRLEQGWYKWWQGCDNLSRRWSKPWICHPF